MATRTLAIPPIADEIDGVAAGLSPRQLRALNASRRIATLMDARWGVGRWRFGVETVTDLIPVVGDLISIGVSLYQLGLARQLGVPKGKRVRMGVNVGIDAALGFVPFAGDFADTVFKAHLRNQRIIDDYVTVPAARHRSLIGRLRRAA